MQGYFDYEKILNPNITMIIEKHRFRNRGLAK